MKTMQPTRKDAGGPTANSSRPVSEAPTRRGLSKGLVAMMVVLGMAAGLFVGFLLWGNDGDRTDPIVAGGGDLTARQEQMVEVQGDYVDAWIKGDGAAAAALFTPDGRIEFWGKEYRVDDGTLESYVDRMPARTLKVLEPMVIEGDTILSFHTLGASTREDNLQFTRTGEVLIRSHVLTE
ncbi:MAG: nuclear transport factor 2 family protein [Acidimicrobiales bacterium]